MSCCGGRREDSTGQEPYRKRKERVADSGAEPDASTHYCTFCDTHYDDVEDAIHCCLAVEAAKAIKRACGTCVNGSCVCKGSKGKGT